MLISFSRLNDKQLEKLSDILSDLGLVSLASVVFPAVFDKVDPLRVVLGIGATLVCWITSLLLRR